jgi:hypothetical protein
MPIGCSLSFLGKGYNGRCRNCEDIVQVLKSWLFSILELVSYQNSLPPLKLKVLHKVPKQNKTKKKKDLQSFLLAKYTKASQAWDSKVFQFLILALL